jgi:hypothetical protein
MYPLSQLSTAQLGRLPTLVPFRGQGFVEPKVLGPTALNRSALPRDQSKFLPPTEPRHLGLSFYVQGKVPVESSR